MLNIITMTRPEELLHATAQGVDIWEQILRNIMACRSVADFLAVYDSMAFQSCLSRIRAAVGSHNVVMWAYEWALRMRNPAPEDMVLNRDRKVGLSLVYTLCDQWKDPLNEVITESTIQHEFKARRLINILQFLLPMDRAQALYAMRYPGASEYGMNWVSKQDVSASKALEEYLQTHGGFPTINHRLVRLMESKSLGLSEIEVFRRWMEPKLLEE